MGEVILGEATLHEVTVEMNGLKSKGNSRAFTKGSLVRHLQDGKERS